MACLALAACSSPATTPSAEPITAAPSASAALPASATPAESASPEATPAPADPAWAPVDAAGPTAREDHTWTVDATGDVAYLFGGRDGTILFGDLWAYELATDTWTQVPAEGGPAPRFGHEAVWADGVGLVVFAGQAGTDFFNDLWAFDPDAGTWRQLPASGDVPVARYGTCAGIGPDERLWISHGFTEDQTRFSDTVAYDFETGAWSDETPERPVPVSRCLHGCWWTDAGELALFGGQTTGVTALDDLWLLAADGWRQVDGQLPAERNLYARARIPAATVVFGGQAIDAGYLADAFILPDGAADAQPVLAAGPAPAARAGAEMVIDADRGRVLLFGGRDADRAYADVWALTGVVPAG